MLTAEKLNAAMAAARFPCDMGNKVRQGLLNNLENLNQAGVTPITVSSWLAAGLIDAVDCNCSDIQMLEALDRMVTDLFAAPEQESAKAGVQRVRDALEGKLTAA